MLLDDTLDNIEYQDLITSLKTKKINLILSGGGGKDAYQVGVIIALFDCGIRNFSSMVDTSVGSLNAALCHGLCRLGDRNLVLEM